MPLQPAVQKWLRSARMRVAQFSAAEIPSAHRMKWFMKLFRRVMVARFESNAPRFLSLELDPTRGCIFIPGHGRPAGLSK